MSKLSKRDANVELFRCVCMVGITLLHVMTWGPYLSRGWDNVGNVGVVGFVLISAYFGINLRPSKVLRIVGISLICAFLSVSLAACFGGGNEWGRLCRQGYFWFSHYWYVWAYVFLMLMAPIVDVVIDHQEVERRSLISIFLPIAFLLWGWSYLPTVNGIARYVPQTKGFGAESGLTLLCIYVLARIIFKLGWIERLRTWTLIFEAVVAGVFVYFGFRHNNNFFSFVLALMFFALIKRMRVPVWLSRAARYMGPSIFSVYLFQLPCYSLYAGWERWFVEQMGLLPWMSQFVMVCFTFAGGVLLDLPRRLLAKMCSSGLRMAFQGLDGAYYLMIEWFARR